MTVSVWGDTGHKIVNWKYFSKTYEPLEPTNNTTMWESSGTVTSLREEWIMPVIHRSPAGWNSHSPEESSHKTHNNSSSTTKKRNKKKKNQWISNTAKDVTCAYLHSAKQTNKLKWPSSSVLCNMDNAALTTNLKEHGLSSPKTR